MRWDKAGGGEKRVRKRAEPIWGQPKIPGVRGGDKKGQTSLTGGKKDNKMPKREGTFWDAGSKLGPDSKPGKTEEAFLVQLRAEGRGANWVRQKNQFG